MMIEPPLRRKAFLLAPQKPIKATIADSQGGDIGTSSHSNHPSICAQENDWRRIAGIMLKQALPLDPLKTYPDEGELEGENIHLWLEEVERDRHNLKEREVGRNSDRSHCYNQEQFFAQVLQGGKSRSKGRRLAIIGASGTGKTTILHQIALWILEKTEDIPIWISLADLGKLSLRQYLAEKWLKRASQIQPSTTESWEYSFNALLKSGQIWLLLDGVDESLEQPIASSLAQKSSSTILNPLNTLTQQLQGWADTKVILTSRSYAWEVDRAIMTSFDVYSPLGLSYPDEVRSFIKKWFAPTATDNYRLTPSWQKREKATDSHRDLAETLCQALEQFGQERVRELVQTPLRLALLCRFWQQRPQLPTTRALLYQQLVAGFYQWQAEKIATTTEQQQQLDRSLGKLALQAIAHPPGLSHRLVVDALGEDIPLFRACIRLGWLKSIGILAQTQEKIYAFSDEIFQDYFAALAIDDWRTFLPDRDTHAYPIFEQRWKRIILLWLGRDDIAAASKDAFIQSLIDFHDGCGKDNFYGKRAYCLAAAGLAEWESSETQTIIHQLLQWALIDKDIPQPLAEAAKTAILETDRAIIPALVRTIVSGEGTIYKEALKLLEKIGKGNPYAITALSERLDSMGLSPFRFSIAESLGKIEPGNGKAMHTLIQWLETTTVEEQCQLALNSLEKIGKGNPKIITALVRRLHTSPSASTQRRAFECLESIGHGNATAIAALVQLIRTTKEPGMRRQAAESLEKIDPGNPTAITVLIQLLQSASSDEIRNSAVYSLGEITPGNGEAIAAIVNLLSTPQLVFTHWLAISSLGKIGRGNREALEALVRLIQSTDRDLLRKEAIESLGKIAPTHPVAITALVQLMETTDDGSTRREVAESLGKLDPGNPEALTALSQLLHDSTDEFTRRQAAASLGKIDPGNLEAVFNLVQLIQTTQDDDIRGLAAESLGEIGIHNPAAIATLIRLINLHQNPKTLKLAAKSLGQSGGGYREAIAALMRILQFSEDGSTRLQAAQSLITILPEQQIADLIAPLKEIFSESGRKPDLASQKVIWHCVQHLPYPDFHSLWHAQPASVSSLTELTAILSEASPSQPQSWIEQLQEQIERHPQLRGVHLIYIDSGEFLEPAHPLIDIYDRMLAQNCPPFEHGIPETLSKLRLYWNTLCRNHPEQTFVWLFYENISQSEAQRIPPDIFQALGKFSGLICGITEQSLTHLQQFSPQMPKLSKAIVEWIEQNV